MTRLRVYCWLCGRLTQREIADICRPDGDHPVCHDCATRLVQMVLSGRDISRLEFRQWEKPLGRYVFRWAGRR